MGKLKKLKRKEKLSRSSKMSLPKTRWEPEIREEETSTTTRRTKRPEYKKYQKYLYIVLRQKNLNSFWLHYPNSTIIILNTLFHILES